MSIESGVLTLGGGFALVGVACALGAVVRIARRRATVLAVRRTLVGAREADLTNASDGELVVVCGTLQPDSDGCVTAPCSADEVLIARARLASIRTKGFVFGAGRGSYEAHGNEVTAGVRARIVDSHGREVAVDLSSARLLAEAREYDDPRGLVELVRAALAKADSESGLAGRSLEEVSWTGMEARARPGDTIWAYGRINVEGGGGRDNRPFQTSERRLSLRGGFAPGDPIIVSRFAPEYAIELERFRVDLGDAFLLVMALGSIATAVAIGVLVHA